MKSYEEIHNEKNKCIIDIIPNFIPNKIDEKIQINIYGNEKSKIPHFHLEGSNFNCCICIFDNKYFIHKNMKYNMLSIQQKDILNEFLNQKTEYLPISIWEFAVTVWYNNNIKNYNKLLQIKYKFKYHKITQPNYSIIDGYRRN
mgnify:CR=1 FL=1